jgi:uncharacterized integral membrane protein (TIGR00701 family)
MTDIIAMLYFWLKSAHIIFVIFWMAGLFMIPRFFVYHQESPEGSEEAAKWVDREGKLIKIILNPSIIVVWVVGMLLAWNIGGIREETGTRRTKTNRKTIAIVQRSTRNCGSSYRYIGGSKTILINWRSVR